MGAGRRLCKRKSCGSCCALQLTDPPLSLKRLPAYCSPLCHVYISVFPSQHSARVVIFSSPALWSVEPCLRCKMNSGRAPQKTHFKNIFRIGRTRKHEEGEEGQTVKRTKGMISQGTQTSFSVHHICANSTLTIHVTFY